MKNILLSFMVLLGGIMNAQSFDFNCSEPEIEVQPEPEPNPNVIEHRGFTYNSENNTLVFRGISYHKYGGAFTTPVGLRNVDRYARIGLAIREDGMWQMSYQNNGFGCRQCPIEPQNYTEDGDYFYNGGQKRSWSFRSFERAVDQIFIENNGTFMTSNIFFADREGPSVNNRRLTNWDKNNETGFTGEPINRISYPGIFRFTKNGDKWDVIMKPSGKPAKNIETATESRIRSLLPGYAINYMKIYNSN